MTTAKIRSALIFCALTLTAAVPVGAFPAMRSVPPESFLDYHVDTVPQLTFEVAYDPAVRARLARHFHLSGSAMCAYVRDNLALQTLSKPLKTRVYCVRPDGGEFSVLMTLKAGSQVFALRRTGKPILRLVCGNPLVAALPPTLKKAIAKAPRLVKPRVAAAKLLQAAPQVVTKVAPSLAAVSAPTTVGLIQTEGVGDVLFTAGGGAGASWLGGVPLAGGTLALLSHTGGGHGGGSTGPDSFTPLGGGGHQSTGVIPITPTPNTPPAPVPEPNPALVLLLGSVAVGGLWLRKRRADARG